MPIIDDIYGKTTPEVKKSGIIDDVYKNTSVEPTVPGTNEEKVRSLLTDLTSKKSISPSVQGQGINFQQSAKTQQPNAVQTMGNFLNPKIGPQATLPQKPQSYPSVKDAIGSLVKSIIYGITQPTVAGTGPEQGPIPGQNVVNPANEMTPQQIQQYNTQATQRNIQGDNANGATNVASFLGDITALNNPITIGMRAAGKVQNATTTEARVGAGVEALTALLMKGAIPKGTNLTTTEGILEAANKSKDPVVKTLLNNIWKNVPSATGIGAGFGLSSGLQNNGNIEEVIKSTGKGALTGLPFAIVGGAFQTAIEPNVTLSSMEGRTITITKKDIMDMQKGTELTPLQKEIAANIPSNVRSQAVKTGSVDYTIPKQTTANITPSKLGVLLGQQGQNITLPNGQGSMSPTVMPTPQLNELNRPVETTVKPSTIVPAEVSQAKPITASNGFKIPADEPSLLKQRSDATKTYQSIGMSDAMGKQKENAGLKILEDQYETPQGKHLAMDELSTQIKADNIKPNADGTITVYRGGTPYAGNKLTSVSTDKAEAEQFGNVQEFKVKPEDIAVSKGLDPNELLVKTEVISPLSNEARKYKSDEDFFLRMDRNTRNELYNQGIKSQEAIRNFWKESNKGIKREQIIDSVNPTGGLSGGGLSAEYNPQSRMTAKLADNITTLDKTMGKSPDEMITIYRGAPKNQKEINPGDFITINPELAKTYTGDGNVISKKVKLSDILDDKTEPLGDEYLYRPSKPSPKLETPPITPKNTPEITEKPTGVSKIAQSVNQKAIEQKLTKGYSEIAGYDKQTIKEQSEMGADLSSNRDNLLSVVKGETSLPERMNPVSAIIAAEEYIKKTGDLEMSQALANSPLISETSKAAQIMRMAAEREPDSITAKFQEIKQAKIKANGGEKKIQKEVVKKTSELKSLAKSETIKGSTQWNNILESVKCK